jgi:hypothetical protein
MDQKLNIETQLLLLCARPYPDEGIRKRIIELIQRENIDWENFLKISCLHQVLPLIHRAFDSLQQPVVPQPIMFILKNNYLGNALNNLLRTEELIRLLELFKENGISALTYKGPILASCAYGNIALRQFSDLDILIEKQNVFKARKLLVEEGYSPDFQLTDNQISHLFKNCTEISFHCEKKGLTIALDIHWSLLQGYYRISYPFEQLWEHRCLHTFNHFEIPVMCLCPEDLFITTCMHHGVHEKWLGLKQICDLLALIDTYKQMDWGKIIRKTNEMGMEQTVLVGIYLANKILDIDIKLPGSILKNISVDTDINSIALKLFKLLINKANNKTQSIFARRLFHFHIHNKRSLLSRLSFKFYRMLQPNICDILLISLPSYFHFLYYLIFRPFRIIRDILREIKTVFRPPI